MIGDLFEIIFFMWVVAILAFAPLGYFIYMYTAKDGEPFGETEPHGDSDSLVLDLTEKALSKVKSLLGK